MAKTFDINVYVSLLFCVSFSLRQEIIKLFKIKVNISVFIIRVIGFY